MTKEKTTACKISRFHFSKMALPAYTWVDQSERERGAWKEYPNTALPSIAATSPHCPPALLSPPGRHGFPSLPRLLLPLRLLFPPRLLSRSTVFSLQGAPRRRTVSPARVPSRFSAAVGPRRGLLRLRRRRPAQAYRHADDHHSRRRRVRGLPIPRTRP
jgi:hypothetical protein